MAGAAPVSWLRARLHDPCEAVSLAGLAERWVQADITLETTSRPPTANAADPALPDRLRGMLGRALMEGASAEAIAGRPCPWQPPCALDLLFGDHGALLSGRLAMPRPFVLAATPPEGTGTESLVLRLSLFGFATDWAETVAEALVRALRGGVALTGAERRPVETRHRSIRFVPPPPLPLDPGGGDALAGAPPADDDLLVRLRFDSPLCIRREKGGPMTPRTLLMGLCNRLAGLARWHDARLEEDWPALAARAGRCQVLVEDMRRLTWTRASGRQKQGNIPVSGLLGEMVLRGPLGPLLPALALGQACGTGAHVALGLGRFRGTVSGGAAPAVQP